MKAVMYERYGGPDVLEVRDIPVPQPGPGEMLVRVRSCMVAYGDYRMRSMDLEGVPAVERFLARLALGVRRPKRRILGMGIAGDVVRLGAGTIGFIEGESVVAGLWHGMRFGGYAEYACVPAYGPVEVKPFNLGYDESLAAIGGIAALSLVRRAGIRTGDRVAVYGASGAVGTTAVQLAKHAGAVVTAVCSGPNRAMVQALGADRVVDYTKEDLTASGVRYDAVLDAVGKLTPSKCKKALTPNGRILSVLTNGHAASGRPEISYLLSLAQRGAFTPVIDRTYPLHRVAEAHRYVESGRKRGNVLLHCDQ